MSKKPKPGARAKPRRQSNELEYLIRKLYAVAPEHAPLVVARLSSIKATLEIYLMVGRKFTKAEVDRAIDIALESVDLQAAALMRQAMQPHQH